MALRRLCIANLRNISQAELLFSDAFNLIEGQNGSGKTSLLEAINLLSLGRSFRTHTSRRLLKSGADSFVVSGELNEHTVGLERSKSGIVQSRMDGETQSGFSNIASIQPLQVVYSGSFSLIDESPKYRRHFIDWGMFHVEPSFLHVWRKYNQLLHQRNAALKSLQPKDLVMVWDRELAPCAEQITQWRRAYFDSLKIVFEGILKSVLNLNISIHFKQGWPDNLSYHEVLSKHLERDKHLSYTYYGPHRADILIHCDDAPAQDVLSRGQKKLLVYALSISQGQLLYTQTYRQCLYLLDDVHAELDDDSNALLMALLDKQKAQTVITGIDCKALKEHLQRDTKVFHVKHGEFSAC